VTICPRLYWLRRRAPLATIICRHSFTCAIKRATIRRLYWLRHRAPLATIICRHSFSCAIKRPSRQFVDYIGCAIARAPRDNYLSPFFLAAPFTPLATICRRFFSCAIARPPSRRFVVDYISCAIARPSRRSVVDFISCSIARRRV
jgi:hypothetical protein